YQLILGGAPVDDAFYAKLTTLEVEESVDLPGAILLKLPVSTDDAQDLDVVNDARLAPFATAAVVATQEGEDDQCIFDGVVLSHKLHLETGTVASELQVWGQDASWLMNLEEKTKEWVDVTDGAV